MDKLTGEKDPTNTATANHHQPTMLLSQMQKAAQPLGKVFSKLGEGIENAAKVVVVDPLHKLGVGRDKYRVEGSHRNEGLRKSKHSNRKKMFDDVSNSTELSSLGGLLNHRHHSDNDHDPQINIIEAGGTEDAQPSAIKFNAYNFHAKDDGDGLDKNNFYKYYHLGKVLYKTDWCRIHICWSILTQRERVVKIVREDSQQGSVHEFDILKETDHPNLSTMYELFQGQQDEFYIVMKYCEGGTLLETVEGVDAKSGLGKALVGGVLKGGTEVLKGGHGVLKGGHGVLKGGREALGRTGIIKGDENHIQESHPQNHQQQAGMMQQIPNQKTQSQWEVTMPDGNSTSPTMDRVEQKQSRQRRKDKSKSPVRDAHRSADHQGRAHSPHWSPTRQIDRSSKSPSRGTYRPPDQRGRVINPKQSPSRHIDRSPGRKGDKSPPSSRSPKHNTGERGPIMQHLAHMATETNIHHKPRFNHHTNKTQEKWSPEISGAPSTTKSPLNEDSCKLIMLQLLSCLNYCHQNQIVHCDVKTGNIMLNYHKDIDFITLIDFDTAFLQTYPGEKINYQRASGTGSDLAYLAPEVVEAKPSYDTKADIWSCGVVLYKLLSNTLPFVKPENDTDEEIRLAVLSGRPIQFPEEDWIGISGEAKEFIEFLLTYEAYDRPTAQQAVTQNWLYGARSRMNIVFDDPENSGATRVLKNLRKFNAADTKMKEAVCSFIASHLLTNEEVRSVDRIFQALDTQHDGKIRRYELKHAFYQVHNKFITENELDKMMDRIDLDGNREISYSEFAMAAVNKKDLLSKSRLKSAFQLFDKTGKGFVTHDELRDAFRFAEMDAQYLNKLILQVDKDGDGEISFEEFVVMMEMSS